VVFRVVTTGVIFMSLPRELFFAPLAVELNPTDYENVQFAYVASKYGHRGQLRDGGGRYFDHPKAAAWIYIAELGGRDPRVMIDLLLHDISEDSYLLSSRRIGLNFGRQIALDVVALTKLMKATETTEAYLHRIIARGPEVIIAKLCDRLHNLRSLVDCTAEKRAKQIAETKQYHLPLLVTALMGYRCSYANTLRDMIVTAIASYD
jgi:guanosine-3',5'-bis(diphosphate) 3'-pyrophosphohydrolase